MKSRLRAIVVGAGHRSMIYASYARKYPDELTIVGVADPSDLRREQAAGMFDLAPERCFKTAEELACEPKFADFVINGTMDHQHVPTSLPLLEAGYDMLLEKPFATNEEEMWGLVAAARQHNRKIAICHVLRHSPFYAAIRSRVIDGVIGDILNIQATEHVPYHQVAMGYVRGKRRRRDLCGCSMLMAKSCHDLDLIAWMKSGVSPVGVASFGSNMQFRPANAPPGAGTRCLVDCPVEEGCLYSARKHYLDHPKRWGGYVWAELEHLGEPTPAQREEYLKGDTTWGRCAWKCDNDTVDHQSVLVDFEDGATATLNMIGGSSKPSRSLHLIGTTGEIQGCLEDSRFVIRHIDPRPGHEYAEETIDLNVGGDMTGAFGGHGGGDLRLVSDFMRELRGKPASISSTRIEDSINGHLIGFCADRSMQEHKVIDIDSRRWGSETQPGPPADAAKPRR